MLEFLQTPAGVAVFSVIIAAVLIAVIDLNYKYFTKAVLDFIWAFICLIICSPVMAACAVISKIKAGKAIESTPYLGVKGKVVYIHTFAGLSGALKNLPKLFDILCGRLAFVGVKLMRVADGAFIDDGNMARFDARPALICHLALKGDESLTYEDTFELDARYAKKRELFTDLYIALKALVLAIRGEGGSYMGEARDKSYAEALLARGTITEADLKRAEEYAEEAVKENEKVLNFKKQRYS